MTTAPDTVETTGSRERLLSLVADLILERGVADLSLSQIGRSIGSNNRMLLYYFDSKENLLNAATLQAFNRFPHIEGMLRRLREGDAPLRDRLVTAWHDIAHPDNLPYLALFFESFGIALHHPSRNQNYFEHVAAAWVPEVQQSFTEAGLEADEALHLATQIVATWRGLQFALLLGTPREALDVSYATVLARILPAT